jgi:hypothetical protein
LQAKRDAPWIKKELVEKHLKPEVMLQFRGVNEELQALGRRIDFMIPFLPFNKQEQPIVADTALRSRFQLYRDPAVLLREPDEQKRRTVGNLHLRHTPEYCGYVVEQYSHMHGASSMLSEAAAADGQFLTQLLQDDFDLTPAR